MEKDNKRINANVMLAESYCDSAMNIDSSLRHYHSNARKSLNRFIAIYVLEFSK